MSPGLLRSRPGYDPVVGFENHGVPCGIGVYTVYRVTILADRLKDFLTRLATPPPPEMLLETDIGWSVHNLRSLHN